MAAPLVFTGLVARVLLPECGLEPVDAPWKKFEFHPWESAAAGCLELEDELEDNPEPNGLGARLLSASNELKVLVRRASMARAPSFVMNEGCTKSDTMIAMFLFQVSFPAVLVMLMT
jgi:hypothetical protein